jgi:16S rRNA processing protein RimM
LREHGRAAALRGRILEVPESALHPLQPGTYYQFQLVGMEVLDAQGRHLGILTEIVETGSNDVYVVKGDGGEVLVPALDDVVLDVDVSSRRMIVDLPDEL